MGFASGASGRKGIFHQLRNTLSGTEREWPDEGMDRGSRDCGYRPAVNRSVTLTNEEDRYPI
jgi:hypothetical protein